MLYSPSPETAHLALPVTFHQTFRDGSVHKTAFTTLYFDLTTPAQEINTMLERVAMRCRPGEMFKVQWAKLDLRLNWGGYGVEKCEQQVTDWTALGLSLLQYARRGHCYARMNVGIL